MPQNTQEKTPQKKLADIRKEFSGSENLEPWQQEVDALFHANQFIQRKARGVESGGFERDDIFNLHKLALNDPFNMRHAGVLRDVPVIKVLKKFNGELTKAAFEPTDLTFLSEEFNEFANDLEEKTRDISCDTPVKDLLELAAKVHRDFTKMQPFRDGNERTARMLVDYIFVKARLPYIVDWGEKYDEYTDVVFRGYLENRLDLLQDFLANKLLERIEGIQDTLVNYSFNNEEFAEYIDKRYKEVLKFLNLD